MRFCSLHHHTTASTGDGYGKVSEHVKVAADYGMKALAVTEHGNSSSHVKLEKECTAAGIKPLFGLEAYTAPPETRQKFHQTVIAETQQGYANLNELIGRSYSEGFYQWPTIHSEWWSEYGSGLVITSGCSDSELNCTLLGGKSLGEKRDRISQWDMDNAEKVIRHFKSIFGDGYYLETQRFPDLERTCLLNPALAELSIRCKVPLVATADVHYPYPADNAMQRILHAAHRGATVEQVDASWEYDVLLSIPTSDKEIGLQLMATGLTRMQSWDAICNSEEIADRCTVVLPKSERMEYPGTTEDMKPWPQSTSTGTG